MDEDIAFLMRVQSYIPIVTWNLLTIGLSALTLAIDLHFWWVSLLFAVIGVAGNGVWLRWRAAHKKGTSRFLNPEVLQIIGYALGVLWFGTWYFLNLQPWKLIVCGVSGLLLALRLKVRADKQAPVR